MRPKRLTWTCKNVTITVSEEAAGSREGRKSAGDRFFVDTNVLLYSVDAAAPGKQRPARLWADALWETGSGARSWQVLHEFYVNTVRQVRLPRKIARQLAEDFAQWRPPEVTIGLIRRACHWNDQAQLSYWDGLIVAAAERLECPWLLSEDFQNGRRFGKDHNRQSVPAYS